MGRKKLDEVIRINRISEELKSLKISNFLLSVWTGAHVKTISSWRSNTSQPSEENLNQLGELFEKDNALLKVRDQSRRSTGLAKALDQELKRLMKVEKIPFEVEVDKEVKKDGAKPESDAGKDNTKGKKSTKTINPVLIEKIKTFAEEYKKNNPPANLSYFDKQLSEIKDEELKGIEVFICDSNASEGELEYQIVHLGLGDDKLVAKFNRIADAEKYVDLIQRGYIDCKTEE